MVGVCLEQQGPISNGSWVLGDIIQGIRPGCFGTVTERHLNSKDGEEEGAESPFRKRRGAWCQSLWGPPAKRNQGRLGAVLCLTPDISLPRVW